MKFSVLIVPKERVCEQKKKKKKKEKVSHVSKQKSKAPPAITPQYISRSESQTSIASTAQSSFSGSVE